MIQRPSRSKPLILIILILLLANIGGLYFFFKDKAYTRDGKPPVDRKEVMNRYLKEELKFDARQLQQFDSLSEKHKLASEPLFEALKDEKEKRLRFLANNNYSDTALQQAVNRSAERQKTLDLTMLQHIRNIRALCNADQREKFDTGFYKMMRKGKAEKKSSGQNNK